MWLSDFPNFYEPLLFAKSVARNITLTEIANPILKNKLILLIGFCSAPLYKYGSEWRHCKFDNRYLIYSVYRTI